jgi:hypothetical protein
LTSLNSFSQKDIRTRSIINKDSVKLHKNIAKKIAKDLKYLDAIKEERIVLLENIDTLNMQKSYKDSVIAYKDKQIIAYKDIISIQEEKETVFKGEIKSLDKQLRRQKLSKKATIALLILSLGFAIVK